MGRNMNIEQLKLQFIELKQVYPQLNLKEETDKIIIDGDITFKAKNDEDVTIIDDYSIRMYVDNDYPDILPSVYETSNKIPKNYNHFLSNGSLCLGVHSEIIRKFMSKPTLLFFMNTFVVNYLYAVSYFVKYRIMPFGERSHKEGIYEYFMNFFDVDSKDKVLSLLEVICLKAYRGHLACPCGSGLNMRKCRHKELLLEAINSDYYLAYYQSDFLNLIKQEKEVTNGKVYSSKR
jgi:hypothetical protein